MKGDERKKQQKHTKMENNFTYNNFFFFIIGDFIFRRFDLDNPLGIRSSVGIIGFGCVI